MKYLHGSNEVNYKKFVCANCGKDNRFGKVICLSCVKEIAELKGKLKETNFQVWRLDECNKDHIKQLAKAIDRLSRRNTLITDLRGKISKPHNVTIIVKGGVVTVTKCPKAVTVEIIDKD